MTTSNVVLPFEKRGAGPSEAPARDREKPRRTSKIERLEQMPGEVLWPIQKLPGEAQCARWVDEYVDGKPYEGEVRSLWQNYPRSRAQAESLLSFITPDWPAADGRPLVAHALDSAGERLKLVIDAEGAVNKPRLLGVFLWGLMSIQKEVGRLRVRGLDRNGKVLQWDHFRQPLLEWAQGHGMTEVLASSIDNVSILWERGMKTTMLAAIADPSEIGFMETYAPHG